MTRKFKICLVGALLAVPMMLMSFTPKGNTPADTFMPKSAESKLIQLAVDNHFISASEAQILKDNNAIKQCADAFFSNGCDPAAAVDKLAEIAVSSGKFKTKAEAKAAMKKTSEAARKKESNWTKLYKMLGL